MLESEAAKRWCPFARAIIAANPAQAIGATQLIPGSTHNRIIRGNETQIATMCLGSGCMLWREEKAPPTASNVISLEKFGRCGMGGLIDGYQIHGWEG